MLELYDWASYSHYNSINSEFYIAKNKNKDSYNIKYKIIS